MRVIDNGSSYTVQMSRREVEIFKSQFPCSGVPSRGIWFQFDKQNGDLVDMPSWAGNYDGAGLVALSQDAQAYGEKHYRKGDTQ